MGVGGRPCSVGQSGCAANAGMSGLVHSRTSGDWGPGVHSRGGCRASVFLAVSSNAGSSSVLGAHI
eukprot:7513480-Pyramimonas_sp.AAC.1